MSSVRRSASSAEKVRAYRARMRANGLRQIQHWVADIRSTDFVAEAARQARRVARSAGEAEDQAFVDAVSWLNSDPRSE